MQSVSSPADWRRLYEAALFETDETRVPERISIARSAIVDRIEKVLEMPTPGEHRAMADALRHLRRLAEITTIRKAA
jgi:hypothetical protein